MYFTCDREYGTRGLSLWDLRTLAALHKLYTELKEPVPFGVILSAIDKRYKCNLNPCTANAYLKRLIKCNLVQYVQNEKSKATMMPRGGYISHCSEQFEIIRHEVGMIFDTLNL